MGKSTSFTLSDHFVSFIDNQVTEGRYGSASDVVRAGLRLLEVEESKLANLRAALIEAEQSGPSEPFNVEQFLAEMEQTGGAD